MGKFIICEFPFKHLSPNRYRKAKRKQKIIMTATVDRRRKYATEEERLEAKSAQRRINDRKYYHQNPEAKIEKVKKYQAENQDKIKAKQREAYAQKKIQKILESFINS